MPSLELKQVSKTYEGKPLLRDISLTLKASETVCLLGLSGSGKSTLLRIIAGLESPDAGSILFDGIDLASTPAHARDFGLVFQDYGLFPHLNVLDNVAFGLKMRRFSVAEIQLRAATLLDQVGLAGFASRKVTDLSGGEQQRVALARSLATKPRLLMLDEPLGALDRTLKEGLLNELRAILHKTKIPAIYVTHDQEEAFAIADRILLLHDGEIVQRGTPQQVWNHPKSVWAAEFLGIGKVIDGVMISSRKVRTKLGTFTMNGGRAHSKGDVVSVLVKPTLAGGEEIKLKVEDVLFSRGQFQVRARGGLVIHLKVAPKIGQAMRIRVKAECLP